MITKFYFFSARHQPGLTTLDTCTYFGDEGFKHDKDIF